jgi:hypothetical protein
MAFDIALNVQTGDIILQDNDLLMVDDAARVNQQIVITCKFIFSEWFLDTRQGIPYFEDIWGKNPNMNLITSIYRSAISNVPDVIRVDSVTLSLDNKSRTLTVNYAAETTFGLVEDKVTLGYS